MIVIELIEQLKKLSPDASIYYKHNGEIIEVRADSFIAVGPFIGMGSVKFSDFFYDDMLANYGSVEEPPKNE